MTDHPPSRLSITDVGINLGLFCLFVWAFVQTGSWSLRASLFPATFVGIGAVLAAFRLLLLARVGLTSDIEDADGGSDITTVDDDEDSADIEYIFSTADTKTWLQALGWITTFFAGLWLLGLYITAPLFSAVYVAVVGRMRWWAALLYGVVAWALLYAIFDVLLRIRMPSGIV